MSIAQLHSKTWPIQLLLSLLKLLQLLIDTSSLVSLLGVQACAELCTGYAYFGTEFGQEVRSSSDARVGPGVSVTCFQLLAIPAFKCFLAFHRRRQHSRYLVPLTTRLHCIQVSRPNPLLRHFNARYFPVLLWGVYGRPCRAGHRHVRLSVLWRWVTDMRRLRCHQCLPVRRHIFGVLPRHGE